MGVLCLGKWGIANDPALTPPRLRSKEMELKLIESDSHRDLHQAKLTLQQIREEIEKVENPHSSFLRYQKSEAFEEARQAILKAIEVKK